MILQEEHVNATEHYRFGDTQIEISDTIFDPESKTLIGDIFKYCQHEFGRCTGKVYIDTRTDDDPPHKYPHTKHVGWVFQKRDRYEDTKEFYLHETWVTLLDKDETIRVREYHDIAAT